MSHQASRTGTGAPKEARQRKLRATIDHRFFPHIVDLIFSHLTYPGLVVCAQTSKSWKEKSTPSLLKHVAVFECGQTVVVKSRNVRWPNLSVQLIVAERSNFDALRCVINTPTIVDLT